MSILRARGAASRNRDNPDLEDLGARLPNKPRTHRRKQQRRLFASEKPPTAGIEYLRPPFAAVHPVPAWAQPVNPMEDCPFEPDSGLDELDAEYRAIMA